MTEQNTNTNFQSVPPLTEYELMKRAQHIQTCKILLHPTVCTRAGILMLQHRTGLLVITSNRGLAQAVPATKGAA